MTEFHAHSANGDGHWHDLAEHLRAVAELAQEFSRRFGGGEAAYYAGLWHDIGKFDPEFQQYLSGERRRGPDHKAAGTMLACRRLGGRSGLIIQGHHGGSKRKRTCRAGSTKRQSPLWRLQRWNQPGKPSRNWNRRSR